MILVAPPYSPPPPPPPEKPKNGESRKSPPISSIVEIFNNNIHPITPPSKVRRFSLGWTMACLPMS